jgi:hypothetical protein
MLKAKFRIDWGNSKKIKIILKLKMRIIIQKAQIYQILSYQLKLTIMTKQFFKKIKKIYQ